MHLTNLQLVIDVRDALILKDSKSKDAENPGEPLSVLEQNLLRDCDIALGLVRCKPETREEARGRVSRMVADRIALAEFERTSGGAPPWSDR